MRVGSRVCVVLVPLGLLLGTYLACPPRWSSSGSEGGLGSVWEAQPPLGRTVDPVSSEGVYITEFVFRDFLTWYEPENASPGDMITFHAGEDAPSGLNVEWECFYRHGAGDPSFPIWVSMRSYEKPTIGMYQMWTL